MIKQVEVQLESGSLSVELSPPVETEIEALMQATLIIEEQLDSAKISRVYEEE